MFTMRRALVTAIIVAGAHLSNLALADYPIASHRYLADPCVLVHDGRVYVYCSNDDENRGASDYLMQSIVCISSSDLKNWTDHGVVFRVPDDASWAVRSWAPAVTERNGKFYLYFGNGGSGIGVAVGESPIGPFTDPLGELLISWSTPGASGENMWLFDPYAFIDQDGQAYLYFGGNGENNVRIVKLQEDMISLDGPAISLTAPGFFEAAWMHERNGIYYFSYSTNPSNGLRIDYMTSDNPVSGFEYAGIVAGQPPSNNNNNHAGIFEFENNWYHIYHNRFVANEVGDPPGYLRNLGIESLNYLEDGAIQQITYTRDGLPLGSPLDPFQRVEGETFAHQSGVETEPCDEGGLNLTSLSDGDWIGLRQVDLAHGSTQFTARVASTSSGAIELRLDSVEGELLGTCQVSNTGGQQTWTEAQGEIDQTLAQGIHDLYLVFKSDNDNAINLNWWKLESPPVAPTATAIPVSSSQIRISWSSVEGAETYRIERSSSQEGPFQTLIFAYPTTEYTDESLEEGTPYYYTVTAIGDFGESTPSIVSKATPYPNYVEWTERQFGELSDAETTAPDSDPDKDRLTNLTEYFQGSDPQNVDTLPFLSIARVTSNAIQIRYRKSAKIASIEARVQKSSDLSTWIDSTLSPESVEAVEEYEILQLQFPDEQELNFIRLAIRITP